jgi:hypothetical protein
MRGNGNVGQPKFHLLVEVRETSILLRDCVPN